MAQPLSFSEWVSQKYELSDTLKKSYAQKKIADEVKSGNQPTSGQVIEWKNNVPDDIQNIYKREGYAKYLVEFAPTFSIQWDDTSYEFKYTEGSTFEQWVNSSYNVAFPGTDPSEKATISGDNIEWYGGWVLYTDVAEMGKETLKTAVINPDKLYIKQRRYM